MEWQLAEAKNRLSEVLNLASSMGPQRVRRRKDAFIVIKEEDYQRMEGKRIGFREFLTQPLGLDELDLARDASLIRNVEL